jgi:ABC-type cobalt transport system, ATPase component
MVPLISLNEVNFFYPTTPDRMVLEGINLQVKEGEFVALVGANGSGKSTLLRLIAGLLNPSQGEVKIAGHNTQLAEEQKTLHTTLGMVFQYPEDQIVGTTVGGRYRLRPGKPGLAT